MSAISVSSPVFRRTVFLAALFSAGACAEYSPTPPLPTAPLAPAEGATAWLAVPSGELHVGDHVTVLVNAARARNVSAIGSFTLKVSYDTAGLRYIGTGASTGGMVLAHSSNGTVTLAGASGSGFTAVTLGTFIMEVVNPGAIESLVLRVEELNTTTFRDQSTRTGVERRVFRLPSSR